MNNSTISKDQYERHSNWGLATAIDLTGCELKMIREPEKVKQFVLELCKMIDMKMYGETAVVDFGDNPMVTGLSFTQMIETSLISGHMGNEHNGQFAYLDVFSCKWYDQQKAVDFAKDFFKAKNAEFHTVIRGLATAIK